MDHEPQHGHKRISGWIWFLFWILILAFGAYLLDGVLNRERNPNWSVQTETTTGKREVVLQRNRYGHYNVTGKINGHEVEFFLDTGATTISIPEKVANEIGLKKLAPIEFYTANGIAKGWATRLDRVSIGDIELYDLNASINPNVDETVILLGMSFLKNIEFTQTGDQLILRQYLN